MRKGGTYHAVCTAERGRRREAHAQRRRSARQELCDVPVQQC